MLKKEQIIQIIREKIFREERPGDHLGSSGHMGNRQVEIRKVIPSLMETGWEVEYEYIVTTETEFTIYPDNPPIEEYYRVKSLMDNAVKILNEKKEWIKGSGGSDID